MKIEFEKKLRLAPANGIKMENGFAYDGPEGEEYWGRVNFRIQTRQKWPIFLNLNDLMVHSLTLHKLKELGWMNAAEVLADSFDLETRISEFGTSLHGKGHYKGGALFCFLRSKGKDFLLCLSYAEPNNGRSYIHIWGLYQIVFPEDFTPPKILNF